MSFTRNLFVGLGGASDWASTNYRAPAGQLGGVTGGFVASALFMPTYNPIGADQLIWGNIDTAAFKGWAIGIDASNRIYASRGDGSQVDTVTYDPTAARLGRRWCIASLAVAADAMSLWINGSLAVSATSLAAYAPGVGQATVGSAPTLGASEFTGLISGVSYSPGFVQSPFVLGIEVARTGQIAMTTDAAPTNSWQVFGYTPGATWAPATGAISLTRQGSSSALTAQAAPSNAWL